MPGKCQRNQIEPTEEKEIDGMVLPFAKHAFASIPATARRAWLPRGHRPDIWSDRGFGGWCVGIDRIGTHDQVLGPN